MGTVCLIRFEQSLINPTFDKAESLCGRDVFVKLAGVMCCAFGVQEGEVVVTNYAPRPEPLSIEQNIKERRLRRAVTRKGYRLRKQRRLDSGAYDYGRYRIFAPNGELAAGDEIFGMTLDEVEDWVASDIDGKG